MAVVVALLMIGGEFDLSAGRRDDRLTGLLLGLLTTEWGFSMWPAIVITFAFAVCVGLFNGFMVMKTKLPSSSSRLRRSSSCRASTSGSPRSSPAPCASPA